MRIIAPPPPPRELAWRRSASRMARPVRDSSTLPRDHAALDRAHLRRPRPPRPRRPSHRRRSRLVAGGERLDRPAAAARPRARMSVLRVERLLSYGPRPRPGPMRITNRTPPARRAGSAPGSRGSRGRCRRPRHAHGSPPLRHGQLHSLRGGRRRRPSAARAGRPHHLQVVGPPATAPSSRKAPSGRSGPRCGGPRSRTASRPAARLPGRDRPARGPARSCRGRSR